MSIVFHRSREDKFSVFHPVKPLFNQNWVEHNTPQLLIGMIALATAFVFAYSIYHVTSTPFTRSDGTWAIATNLVDGHGYTGCSQDYFPFCSHTNQATAMREPIPVLLMAVAMLIYPSQLSGVAVLSLLYMGTFLVIYAILQDVDRRLAFLAAFLWVISVPVIKEISNDTGELAAAFFLAAGIYFFQKGRKEQKSKYWILSGIFLGITALSRTIFLGIALGLAFGLLYERLKVTFSDRKEQIRPVWLFLVSMGLIIAPWLIRNYIVFETPVIGSTLTGYNIFRMNFIVASNNFFPHYVGPSEAYPVLMNLIRQGNLLGLENEAQMQAFYMKAGLQIISQHPLQYIYLSLYRFLPLWFNTSVGIAYGNSIRWLDYVTMFQQMVLLVGVILGAARSRKENWPFILALILGCGAYMAVDAQIRYLVDLMPVIVILAAYALLSAENFLTGKRILINQEGADL
jgi:hypothetical protein